MGPNSKSPRENVPVSQPGHDNSDEFDANEFGRFRLSANFFKWAISTPLPRERDEDLWRDTLPPREANGHPPKDAAQEPTARLRPLEPGGAQRVLELSPSEAQALGKKPNRGWIPATLLALATAGGTVTYFAAKSPEAPPTPELALDLTIPEIVLQGETSQALAGQSDPREDREERQERPPETNTPETREAAPRAIPSHSASGGSPKETAQLVQPGGGSPPIERKSATPAARNANQEKTSTVEPKIPPKRSSWFEMN